MSIWVRVARWALLLGIFAALLLPAFATAQRIPERKNAYLVDYAGLISPSVYPSFEQALEQFHQETGVDLFVVTVPDLAGDSIDAYAPKLYQKWGIGTKGVDNGILLLHAKAENKTRIEVGYGMEPYLTDSRAGRILDEAVLPDRNAGNHEMALLKGSRAIAQAIIDSDFVPGTVRAPAPVVTFFTKLGLLVPLGFLSIYLVSFFARTKEVVLGTLYGGAVGGLLAWVLGAGLLIVGGVAGGLILGFVLDFVLSRGYRAQVQAHKPTTFHRSRGGFSGGFGGWGGGGGFGGGGGGFGGFGGGSSGGGGASR